MKREGIFQFKFQFDPRPSGLMARFSSLCTIANIAVLLDDIEKNVVLFDFD